MNFGYSAGDFLAVATVCWQVYKKCKDSSGEFKDVSVEVSCLHSVLNETEEILTEENLTSQQVTRLKPLKDGVLDLLKELERRLEKYESLGTQSKRTLDRMGWAMEGGVAELRQKLISQTTLLDAFNNCASHARIERKLNQLVNEIRAGKRQGSIVSSQTFDGNDRQNWQELRRELEDIGISGDVIREKRSFIILWFQEAIAAGRLDEDELHPDSEGEQDQDNQGLDIRAERAGKAPPSIKPIEKIPEQSSIRVPTTQVFRKRNSRLRPSYLLYALKSDELLITAASEGNAAKVEQLLGWGADVNYRSTSTSKNSKGWTSLGLASAYGYEAVARVLLDNGADIDGKDSFGTTPLHWTAYKGPEAVARLLVDKGANINATDNIGRTALNRAAEWGTADVACLLIDRGANIESRDNWGQTALYLAISYGKVAVVQLLIDRGANMTQQTTQNEPLSMRQPSGEERT